MCVSAMNRFIAADASDHFTLVPAISIGRCARCSSASASRTSTRSGDRRGAVVRMRGM